MLRLTPTSITPDQVVLKVEGWIADQGVGVLAQEVERLLDQSGNLVLDLRGVRFIDQEGLALFGRWPRDRVRWGQASGFVEALLEAYGL